MKSLTGINIQFPISRLILEGSKTIETRTYPLPAQYVGQRMAIIETPGASGGFDSRIVGTIVFSDSFQYKDADSFYKDKSKHFVTKDSPWAWVDTKPKWAWLISEVSVLKKPRNAPKRKGIVYTKGISVSAH